MDGEGNFNWRFVFPFNYIPSEKKLVVAEKVISYLKVCLKLNSSFFVLQFRNQADNWSRERKVYYGPLKDLGF